MAIYMWREATPAGIYWSSTLGLITIADGAGNDITIADKNLGATSIDISSSNSYGKFYQWGNCFGFTQGAISSTTGTRNAAGYGPDNYYSVSLFYKTAKWDSSSNINLRGGVTGTNEARKGPCDTGFHIPTNDEFVQLNNVGQTIGAWTSWGGANIRTYLKLPYNGEISYLDATISNQGTEGDYWTCESSSTAGLCYNFGFRSGNIYVGNTTREGSGKGIRPFANTPTQPDSSRTKLY